MATEKKQLSGLKTALGGALRNHWKVFLIEGIVLVVLGLAAVIVPPVATIAIALLIGWLLLISGVLGLVTSFWARRAPGFLWSLASAIIALVAGFLLLSRPLTGAFSLTVILTVFLTIEGVASLLYALDHKRELSGRWGMMLVSGVIDLILAGMIFVGLPASAAWAIGLLVGINLVFGGSALIAMALHARGSGA